MAPPVISSAQLRSLPSLVTGRGARMWEDRNYCWVVLCKNHWIHLMKNFLFSHRIPLGFADAYMSVPPLNGRFSVKCDVCGAVYSYEPSEVMRVEQDLPDSFKPHPLFRGEGVDPGVADLQTVQDTGVAKRGSNYHVAALLSLFRMRLARISRTLSVLRHNAFAVALPKLSAATFYVSANSKAAWRRARISSRNLRLRSMSDGRRRSSPSGQSKSKA
jgi:hypothetical protein